jgi:hypothetical protein
MLTDQESFFATAFISSVSLFAGKPPLHKEPTSSQQTSPLNFCFQAVLPQSRSSRMVSRPGLETRYTKSERTGFAGYRRNIAPVAIGKG